MTAKKPKTEGFGGGKECCIWFGFFFFLFLKDSHGIQIPNF